MHWDTKRFELGRIPKREWRNSYHVKMIFSVKTVERLSEDENES